MLQETNLVQVKSIAKAMLLMELRETEFSPAVVQHPFTSFGISMIYEDGETTMLDLVQKKEDLHTWRVMMSKQIEKADDAFRIYMMVNKPYALAFLKYASPYLSREDFSKILSCAWIESENPNCDPNVGQRKLISMFKDAAPDVLMDETEREELNALEDPVTVYRGVTSYNADHVRAMSWTLNYDVAKWFAHRFGEEGTVYQAQINKEHRSELTKCRQVIAFNAILVGIFIFLRKQSPFCVESGKGFCVIYMASLYCSVPVMILISINQNQTHYGGKVNGNLLY